MQRYFLQSLRLRVNLLLLLLQFFVLVISIEITILAHSSRIGHSISVLTFGRKARSTIEMVTVVAHALGIMSLICVRTPSNLLLFPIDLFLLFAWFLPTTRFFWFGSFPLATIGVLKFCRLGIHQVFLELGFCVVQDIEILRLTDLSTSASQSLNWRFLRYLSRFFSVRFFV